MKFCSSCGKEIPADSQYCPFCGAHVALPVTETKTIVTEPGRTERVVTEPVRTEKVVTKPVVTNIYKGTSGTHRRVEFYLNPGFWGSLLVLAGFFLPIKNVTGAPTFAGEMSLYNIVKQSDHASIYIYLVFPITAVIILLQSLTHAIPGFISITFKILSLAVLGLLAYVVFTNPSEFGIPTNDVKNLLPTIGLGIWFTVIGTLIMLFSTNYRRVERKIDRVDRIDERL